MNLPSFRVGRFGADPKGPKGGDDASIPGVIGENTAGPYAGLLRPPQTPIPPERFFGVPHRLLYRTAYWGDSTYNASHYDMVIKWVPESKAYKLVEQSDAVAMLAGTNAAAAGIPLYGYIGGATVGRYLKADDSELPNGGGIQGSASSLAAYNHTAAMAQKAADEAAALVALAEAEADAEATAEAQAEADAIQAEADRLAGKQTRTRWLLGGALSAAALITRAFMWKKK